MHKTIPNYKELIEIITAEVTSSETPFLIAISGPPASGKSTLAARLVADLNDAGMESCFCPMDGFHLTNKQLDQQGLRKAKGRIDTFDGVAFAKAVECLTARVPFWWPLYSRQRHNPIPEGTRILGNEKIFVIEGNYVLVPDEPWLSAAKTFNLRIFVDAPDTILRQRLLGRHKQSGRSEQIALEKIEQVDMPNTQEIRDQRQDVDIIYRLEPNV
ncbi:MULTISPECIES: AAA family ATPase [unclassified Lentilitoribacter]|jgi:pantothenate kinase|uniref:AAA family ATPase n=1 Tax=unclassified Lentilitoribacter TaxID=2647570 RepID=UPI0013A6A9DF|nr:AAA family ATPase [Lentilitoribacter sp. Alg239-R112]